MSSLFLFWWKIFHNTIIEFSRYRVQDLLVVVLNGDFSGEGFFLGPGTAVVVRPRGHKKFFNFDDSSVDGSKISTDSPNFFLLRSNSQQRMTHREIMHWYLENRYFDNFRTFLSILSLRTAGSQHPGGNFYRFFDNRPVLLSALISFYFYRSVLNFLSDWHARVNY